MPNRFPVLCVLAVSGSALALAIEPEAQRGSAGIPRVNAVYVSAVDRRDAPVTGLTATDFVFKEGGDVREIVRVERATAPMQIAVIVDDSGTGIFRSPVATFLNRLLGRTQFAIGRIVGQVQSIVDYTSDAEQLRNAVLGLGARAETPKGGRLVEAVSEAAKELRRRDAERPVIVVLTDTDVEYSTLPAQKVLEDLQQSGAILYVISVLRRTAFSTVPGVATAADKPSDLLERQLDVNRVLGDGPKQSGGRRAEIAGLSGAIPDLQEIAEELSGQYLVTYIVPAGERSNQKISVSSRRSGVVMRAPARSGRGR